MKFWDVVATLQGGEHWMTVVIADCSNCASDIAVKRLLVQRPNAEGVVKVRSTSLCLN
jgi:hypothetical protein